MARSLELHFLCYTIPLLYEDGLLSAWRWARSSHVYWHPREGDIEMICLMAWLFIFFTSSVDILSGSLVARIEWLRVGITCMNLMTYK